MSKRIESNVDHDEKRKMINKLFAEGEHIFIGAGDYNETEEIVLLSNSFQPLEVDDEGRKAFMNMMYRSLFDNGTILRYAITVQFLLHLLQSHPKYGEVKEIFEKEVSHE